MTYQKRITRGDQPTPVGNFMKFSGHLSHNPFATLDEIGQRPPYWVESPEDVDGYWVVSRFEDVRELLQDPETFSSTDFFIPYMKLEQPLLPSESNPPYTQQLRTTLMPTLTAKRIQQYEPRMREVCTEIIGGFAKDGHCDVVGQFARIYPTTIFLELFGLSTERTEEFRQHANTFLHDRAQAMNAWASIRGIVEEQIVAKRKSPEDDLLSAVGRAEIDGKLLDLATAVNLASAVFLGGLDTLPSNIAWGLRFLAEHPEYRRQIVESPEVIPGAVEEFLRMYSVANSQRRLAKDITFHGANMVAGDRVYVSIAGANRDVCTFGDKPDFTRKANPHLSFATGPHRCLGSHLARHELGISLEIWHKLIPDYRVAKDAKFDYSGGVFAMESLPLEWDV